MKVLIADDQTQRYQSLIKKIMALGIARENISLVSSAKEAEHQLAQTKFDIFILDILLPLWSEDMGDNSRFSQDILLSLYNSDEFRKPNFIIGITGDKSTVSKEMTNFTDYLWGVVEYSASCSKWEDVIIRAITYLDNAVSSGDLSKPHEGSVDLAILCALKTPEFSELLKLNWNWGPAEALSDKLFFRRGHFFSGGQRFSVVAAHCERMGMVASTLASASLINRFSPKIIAMTGICAGVEDKVNLGDIIFAEFAWDYQNGKRLENDLHEIAPHQLHAAACVKAHIELLEDNAQFFKELALNYEEKNISKVPTLHIGPMAVGSSVLADKQIVEKIEKQSREVLGIEMEIYGLYYAAQNSPSPSPKVFAIKSVCDYANSEKNDDYQQYAAYTSANTLKKLMEQYSINLIN